MNSRVKMALVAGAVVAATGFGYAVGQAQQPHMQAALGDLQGAKAELQVAEHNKGGHRANALGLVNQAIAEVNAGILAGA
jgi:uncharacterized membrane protein